LSFAAVRPRGFESCRPSQSNSSTGGLENEFVDAKVLWTGVGQKLPQISSNQRLSKGSPSVTENLGTKSYGDVGIEVEETRRRCINAVPAPGLALGASFARCAVPRSAGSVELGWIVPALAHHRDDDLKRPIGRSRRGPGDRTQFDVDKALDFLGDWWRDTNNIE